MRKKKDYPILVGIEITGAGAEGNAIAKVDGMVIFVPYAVPGDIVDIKILKKKKNFAEGRIVNIREHSTKRVQPECPHFGVCGGCKWQNMEYAEQLKIKQQQVIDNLERIGNVDTSQIQEIRGASPIFQYRNKLEYTFSTKEWLTNPPTEPTEPSAGALGFHVPGLFDKVLNITYCALQREPSNAIRIAVRDYAKSHNLSFYDIRNHIGFLRNLVIRTTSTGEWMVIVIVAEMIEDKLFPLLDFIHGKFPEITSLQYIINNKFNDSYTDQEVVTYYGNPFIVEKMPGYNGAPALHFRINPKSFYQTNSEQAFVLYSRVADFADLKGDETVYDLYTGTGTIAQFIARMCKKVVGIEYVEEAIADAKENAKRNGLDNTEFYAGDMAKVLTAEFIAEHGTPDTVITDPPRAGMHEKVIEQLLNASPRKIVYVSCNPATQARDLQMLSEKYSVARIQPVDMFPHTHHVENIAELLLKQ